MRALASARCGARAAALLAVAAVAAADAGSHTLEIAYNATNGNMSLVFDSTALVYGAFPQVYSLTWDNGTAIVAPPWNWFHDLNASFSMQTQPGGFVPVATYNRQHYWANVTVTHTRAAADSLTLDMKFTMTNTAPYPLVNVDYLLFGDYDGCAAVSAFNFPRQPRDGLMACGSCWSECGDVVYCAPQFPQAIPMDWGTGAAAFVITDAPLPPALPNVTLNLLSLNGWHPRAHVTWLDVGATLSATFSLRFGDGGGPTNDTAPPVALSGDVLSAFAAARPFTTPTLARAPIGKLFGSNCGSSCTCPSYSPQDCPNPRGWDGDIGSNFNVTSPEGVAAFQEAARAWVNRSVVYCVQKMQCQGILFWSIEGSEFSWDTYVGSPDKLAELAPEMDAVADELVGMVTGAGLRVGFTLRPQILTPTPGWNSSIPPNKQPQKYYQRDLYLPDNSTDVAAYAANIISKAQYAIQRWNASMFYVDTTANKNGVLPSTIWDTVHAVLPDIVFFPEESDALDFSVTAPLQDNWGGNAISVNPSVKYMWPAAYSLQLMQFESGGQPIAPWVALVDEGDVLTYAAWYDAPDNTWIKSIYDAAAARTVYSTPNSGAERVQPATLRAVRLTDASARQSAALQTRWVRGAQLAADAHGAGLGNGTYDYENPAQGPCNSGEIPAVVTGAAGQWCSPACSTSPSVPCSSNIYPFPPWVTEPAQPQCMLQYAGQSQPTGCALVCDPSAWGACPPGANCQPIDSFGICTYALPSQAALLPRNASASAVLATSDATPLRVSVTADGVHDDDVATSNVRFSALPWSARHVLVSVDAPACVEVAMIAQMSAVDRIAAAAVSATTSNGMRAPRDLAVRLRVDASGCRGDNASAVSRRVPLDVIVQVPRDVMHESLRLSAAGGGAAAGARIAACSDGMDNDGDRLTDYPLDLECNAPWMDAEMGGGSSAPTTIAGAPALQWTVLPAVGNGSGINGARISLLQYLPNGPGGVALDVWRDEMDAGQPNATRWFLHDQSEAGSSLSLSWMVNDTNLIYGNGVPLKTLLNVTATSASFLYTYPDPAVTVEDDISIVGSTLYITVSVTNAYTDPSATLLVGLPMNFGSLALGRRDATGVVNTTNSGIWRFDGKRVGSIYLGANSCGWSQPDIATDAYPTFGGYFSPLAGYGDANMTIGVSTMDAMQSPDAGHNFSVNYFQFVAARRSPLLQQWHTMVVPPNSTHTFVVTFAVGAPADVGVIDCSNPTPPPEPAQRDIHTAVAVYAPYFTFFASVHGTTPTYCPTPGSAWMNAVDIDFNRSAAFFLPNTTLKDVLVYNWSATALPPTGIPLYGVWSIALQSQHMTLNGGNYEFNPLIESIDPNLDAGCDHSKIGEAVAAFAGINVTTMFWFHRPCNDIVIPPANNVSAFLTCNADGTWNVTKGSYFNNGELLDLNSTYAARQLARADYMISQGPNGFYLDSYFCSGGLRYVRELYRRHPPGPGESGEGLWMMPEGAIDSRSVISHQLPWVSIGSWSPRLSDDFGVLIPTFLPLTSHYGGEIGPGMDMDDFTWSFQDRLFNAVFLSPFDTTNSTTCGWIHDLYNNYATRMTQYGAAMGCKVYEPPTPTCS